MYVLYDGRKLDLPLDVQDSLLPLVKPFSVEIGATYCTGVVRRIEFFGGSTTCRVTFGVGLPTVLLARLAEIAKAEDA